MEPATLDVSIGQLADWTHRIDWAWAAIDFRASVCGPVHKLCAIVSADNRMKTEPLYAGAMIN